MAYKLVYSASAERDLSKLDNGAAKAILKKMDYFMRLDNPLIKAKRLQNVEAPVYRFRIGDYRVIFRKDDSTGRLVVLVVLRIAHRKEVYRET